MTLEQLIFSLKKEKENLPLTSHRKQKSVSGKLRTKLKERSICKCYIRRYVFNKTIKTKSLKEILQLYFFSKLKIRTFNPGRERIKKLEGKRICLSCICNNCFRLSIQNIKVTPTEQDSLTDQSFKDLYRHITKEKSQ